MLAKGCTTIWTLEYILVSDLSSMCLHVSCQLAALSTGVGTHFTLIRLLPRVAAPVHCQVTAVLENLSTELTGLLTCSYHLVLVLGIKEGPNLSLLDKGLDSAGLHRGQASGQENGLLTPGLGDGGRAPEARPAAGGN